MDKQILNFTVNEQNLNCENPIRISTNKVNYIQANFDLGENWDGFDSVRAVWFNDFNCISTVLDSLGNCVVPFEVMKRKGNVKVNLVGSISEDNVLTDRLTSYPVVAVIVDCTAQINGANTSPITPSEYEQFVAAVHEDAERAEAGATASEQSAQNAHTSEQNASQSAQSAHDDKVAIEEAIAEVIQQIEDFEQVQVVVNTLPPSSQATSDFTDGVLTLGIPQGVKGDTGNGIQSIRKTGTSGLVDTYTITLTDGQTTTFTVTNGSKGDTGNGISTIEKTSTVGLVDTYTITYTNGNTTTFTVTNGEKGDKGDTGEVSQADLDEAVSDLKADINDIASNFSTLSPYFYKANTYINANGVETALNGYDLYKIPCEVRDIIHISYSEDFWGGLSGSYIFKIEKTDDTIFTPTVGANGANFAWITSKGEALVICPSDYKYLYICVKADLVASVSVAINHNYVDLLNPNASLKSVKTLNDNDGIRSIYYMRNDDTTGNFSSPYYALWLKVNAGDKFSFSNMPSDFTNNALLRNSDGTYTAINTAEYTLLNDGVLCIFLSTSVNSVVTYYPVDSIKIEAKNIVGGVPSDQFNGLNAVAFGTSLTYRSQTTGGYLQYLPAMSGLIVDNQGIGSSYILGGMLTAIKNYASYSGKRVCLFEGFVNDWYNNKALGTYEDTTEDTVCGCVRSALNHMLTQNRDMTIFLILDHYGRNYNGVNCSPSATNGAGLTQFEYYEEIAKVAESMGIATIKLYAFSGMNGYTPQYFLDNIHPNALGAEQTANAIWSQLKQYYPNKI